MRQDRPAREARNRSAVVLQEIPKSVEALRNEGSEPTFNAILDRLRSRRVLSNHRSLRAHLDIMVASGVLNLRREPVEQRNVRPKQIYSPSPRGPVVEAGEKALMFHGLNWTVPSESSIKVRTDIEGLARARLAHDTVYGSLEDAVVETLTKSASGQAASRALTFDAALLATKKFDYEYLMRRAREKGVEELVRILLEEIAYVLGSPKPEVSDVRTLFRIRKRLVHFLRSPKSSKTGRFPLSQDELVDAIGKQLGEK